MVLLLVVTSYSLNGNYTSGSEDKNPSVNSNIENHSLDTKVGNDALEMMAASVSRRQYKEATGSNPSATFNSSPIAGNLLVVIAGHRKNAGTPSISGSGWSQDVSFDVYSGQSSYRRGMTIWTKIATPGESSTITASAGSSSTKLLIQEYSVSGGSFTMIDELASNPGTTSSSSSIPTGTTATTSNSNILVVAAMVGRDYSGTTPNFSNGVHTPVGSNDIGTDYPSVWSGFVHKTSTGTQSSTANLSASILGSGAIIAYGVSLSSNDTGICSNRESNGLIALYNFDEGSGSTVNDVSGYGSPLNLTIANTSNTSWLSGDCGLSINSSTIIESSGNASKISTACKATNEYSLEIWAKASTTSTGGPARLIEMGDGPANNRNFLFGPDYSTEYDSRIRTTSNPTGYAPALHGGFPNTSINHYVVTRNSSGVEKMYINGSQVSSHTIGGNFSNWLDTYTLQVANRTGLDRAWLGELYKIAIYDKDLSSSEITDNYNVGRCCMPVAEICDNGIDDDGDGQIDCNDSECSGDPACNSGGGSNTCNLTVRALGKCGGETISLKVNGSIVATYTLTTSFANYTYNGYTQGQNVSIQFFDANPGCNHDARIDYITAGNSTYEMENATNDDSCNNSGSEWMYCSGTADFGNLVCSQSGGGSAITCTSGQTVDHYGKGCSGSNININVPNLANVVETIIEVVYKGCDPGNSITVSSSIGNISLPEVSVAGGSSSVRVYRTVLSQSVTNITATSSCGTCGTGNGLQSLLVYAVRNVDSGVSYETTTTAIHDYCTTETFSIPISTSTATRDVSVILPLSEITDDGRYMTVEAKSNVGSASDSETIYGPDLSLGCCFYLMELEVLNVPANATAIDITIYTDPAHNPNSSTSCGQSYVIGGTTYTEIECSCVDITANAGPNKSFCLGSSATLSGSKTGGYGTTTYSWSPSTGLSNAAIASPVASPSTTTTYTLTVTGEDGCSDTDQVLVSVINNYTNGGTISGDQLACGGYNPTNITNLTSPSGGSGGTPYYIWQKRDKPCGGSYSGWSTISGANSITYNPPAITITTQYRRLARRAASCSTAWVYSNVVTKTVVEQFTSAGTVSGNETNCGSYNPANITSTSVPTGGCEGSVIYRWQSRTKSCTTGSWTGWANINTNGASATYNPPTITETTQYRRVAWRAGGCTPGNVISNVITKTVIQQYTSGGAISGDESVCAATLNPALITSTTDPVGGCEGTQEVLWYKWEQNCSTQSWGSGILISGATGLTYDPPAITVTTRYRRYVRRASDCTGDVGTWMVSNFVYKNIHVDFANGGTITADQESCGSFNPANLVGTVPTGSCSAQNINYQWQSREAYGGAWSDIVGATSQNYNPPSLSVTTQFIRVVSTETCGDLLSNVVTMTINIDPEVTLDDTDYCPGSSATLEPYVCINYPDMVIKGPLPNSGWSNDYNQGGNALTGDGKFCFDLSVAPNNSYNMLGLNSDPDTNESFTSIDFAIYVIATAGNYRIRPYENGSNRGDVYSSATNFVGSTFCIERKGTTIRYYMDGNLLYTSTLSSSGNLYFDNSFNGGSSQHAEFTNINLCGYSSDISATYSWSTSANSSTIAVNSGGNYTVTVTDANGCSDSDQASVSSYSNDVTPNVTGDNSICNGETTTLTVTASNLPTHSSFDNNLKAYYPFINNVSDKSQSNLDLSGTTPSFSGGGLDLAASTGLTSVTTDILDNDNHTISFYLKPTTTDPSWRRIFYYGQDRSPGLWIRPNASNIHWRYNPNNGGSTHEPILAINQWHHVVGVKNGATFYLYINGELIGSSTVPNPKASLETALQFGNARVILREFKIFDASLTQAQVQDMGRWVWYTGGCGSGSPVGYGASIDVSPSSNTTYYVRWETDCEDSACDQIAVTSTALPNATASNDGPLTCANTSVVLTANPSGMSYAWSGGGTSRTKTITSPGTYTVTVTNSQGCTSTAQTVVTENTTPTNVYCERYRIFDTESATWGAWINFSGNCTIEMCANGDQDDIQFDGGPNINTGWVWTDEDNIVDSEVDEIVQFNNIGTNDAGTYTGVLTNSNGCVSTVTFNVVVHANPNATATNDGPITCADGTVTLTASPAGMTYAWSGGGTGITKNVTAIGTYTVTVTDSEGCSSTAQTTVSNDLTPPSASAGSDKNICGGTSTTLTATGGSTYLWSNGGTSATISVSPTADNTYTVTVTAANGCTDTDNVIVTVDNPSADPYAGEDVAICPGESVTLEINENIATGNLIDYSTWTVGTGSTTGFNQNGSTSENHRINGQGPWGESTVVWEARPAGNNSSDGGWNTTQFDVDHTKTYRYSVWVNRKVLGVDGRFYLGTNGYGSVNGIKNIVNNSTSTNPYFEYSLMPPTDYGEDNWVLVVGHVHPSSHTGTTKSPDSGVYSTDNGKIENTIADYKWLPETTKSIHRSYLFYSTTTVPRQQFLYPRVDLVDGTEPSIDELLNGYDTNAGLGDGDTWEWYTGSCGGSSVGNGSTLTVSPSVTTTYYVRGEGNCGNTICDQLVVTVNTPPAASASNDGPITCADGTVTMTATPAGMTYAWSGGGTGQTKNVTAPGTYTVTVTDGNGCTDTAQTVVTEETTPTNIFCERYRIYDNTLDVWGAWTNFSGNCIIEMCENAGTDHIQFDGGPNLNTGWVWTDEDNIVDSEVDEIVQFNNIGLNDAGVYTGVYTNQYGCTSTVNFTVVVNANPIATASNNGPITCANPSITLTANPTGMTYAWSGGGTSRTKNVTTPGTYVVTVTDANGCSSTAATIVTEDTTNPTATVNSPSICVGESAVLTASGGTSYAWSTSASTTSITVAPASTTTYTVTVTASNGCSDVATSTVIVNPLPVNTITKLRDISCTHPLGYVYANVVYPTMSYADNSEIITGSAGCGSKYLSSTGVNPYSIVAHNLPGSVSANNTYEFSLKYKSSAAGAGSKYARIVYYTATWAYLSTEVVHFNSNVNSWTDLVISGIAPVNAANVQLSLVIGTGNDIETDCWDFRQQGSTTPIYENSFETPSPYSWSGPNGNAGIARGIYVTVPGTYTVTITNPTTGCINTNSVVVTENIAVPDVTASNDGEITCANTTVNLSATSTVSNATYLWSNNATTANTTTNSAGTYTVTVTDPVNGCTNTASTTVTENTTPTNIYCERYRIYDTASSSWGSWTNFSGSCTIELCENGGLDDIQFDGGPNINTGWVWTDEDGNIDSEVDEQVVFSNIDLSDAGTYTGTLTNEYGCVSTISFTVVVNANPVATATNDGPITCADPTVTLTATPAGMSYSWSGGGTASTKNVTAPGTYTVTVTDSNGCSSTAETVVTEDTTNPIANAGQDVAICLDANASLTATGGSTYAWNNGLGAGASHQVSPASTTTYQVTVTAANGCTDVDQVVVTVNSPPNGTATNNGPITCNNPSVTLTANPAGMTYSWSGGGTSRTKTVTAIGTYTVTITDTNGCTSTAQTTVTEDISSPTANAGANQTVCSGDNVSLTATGGGAYSWSTGGNTATININPTYTATYTVTVTSANGCTDTDQVNVLIDNVPTTPYAGPDQDICLGESISLSIDESLFGGGEIDHTVWQVGTGSSGNFSRIGSNDENHRIYGEGPWNESSILWEARPDTNSDADGGWNMNAVTIDHTKAYRVSVWINRKVRGTDGRFYIGVYGNGSVNGVKNVTNDAVNLNPYFWYSTPGATDMPEDEWVLVVGHIYPSNHTGTSLHSESGRYTVSGGKIGNNYIDFKWLPETNTARPRTYLFYATDQSVRQQWTYPRFDVLDGNEPSIDVLLNGYDSNQGLAGTGSWEWFMGSCGGTSAGSGTSITVSPTTTTTYYVRGENHCGDSVCDEVVVTVNNPPVASVTKDGEITCSDPTVTLTAAPSGMSYAWSGGGTSITKDVSTPGNYTVTVTDANGCSDITSITVTENTTPTTVFCERYRIKDTATDNWGPWTNFSGNCTIEMCENAGLDDIQFDGGPDINTGWVWTDESNNVDTEVDEIVQFNNIGANDSGTYTGVLTNEFGCTSTVTFTVVVNANPIATASNDGPITCNQPMVTMTATPAGMSYAWSGGGTSITKDVTTPGTYIVTVTDTHGCSSTSETTVTEDIAAPVANAGIDQSICLGTSATLSAAGGVSYSWDNGIGLGATKTVSPTSTTIYTVTVTAANGCTATDEVQVVVNEAAIISAATYSDEECDASCTGIIAVLVDHAITGDYNLSYVSGGNTINLGPYTNGDTIKIKTLCAGSYSNFTVTGISSGCTDTWAGNIVIKQTGAEWEHVTHDEDVTNCDNACNGSFIVDANYALTGPYFVDYTYNGVVTRVGPFTSAGDVTITGLCAGNYSDITIVSQESGCIDIWTGTIEIKEPRPEATVTGKINDDCLSSEGEFTVNITGGYYPYTINWESDDSSESGTLTVTGEGDHTVDGLLGGHTYCISIVDVNGCNVE